MRRDKGGFGVVYQEVTRSKNLSAATKGLYAYLSAFCNTSDECFPSVETILREMGMGKDTFYRHINALVAAGVVEKRQSISTGGKFGRTIYRLTHKVVISDYPIPQNRDTDATTTEDRYTNNNNINNNNILNNNNSIICPEQKAPDVKPSGILLPLIDKTDYDVPLSKIEGWEKAYPAVDIKQELHKMAAWLESNPQRKKTRRGIDRFINTWLSKEQDRGGVYRNTQRQQAPKAGNYELQPEYQEMYDKHLGNMQSSPDDPFQ
ncbi:MAG: hypothetical protein HDR24_00020 [Lachnospiraceae bacterium]|nr:hypothetical protein [Lachnospiraceae bacterium]